jgi:hypothetical protein
MIVTLQFSLLRLQNPDSSLCVMVYCIQENEQIYMAQSVRHWSRFKTETENELL